MYKYGAALLALILMSGFGGGQAATQTAEDDALRTLQTYLHTHPASRVFEGLCALPETKAAYSAALAEAADPDCYAPDDLPSDVHAALVERLAERLRAMSGAERTRFFVRLGHWVTVQRELDILAELTSSEQMMAAAFKAAPTRALFEEALRARGLDGRKAVDPLTVGATLAAAEHDALRQEIATLISARPVAEQLVFYRDLFAAAQSLLADEAASAPPHE